MKTIVRSIITCISTCIAIGGCLPFPQTEIVLKSFVPEIINPYYFSVGYTEASYPLVCKESEPALFRCKLVDGKLYNIDHLSFASTLNFTTQEVSYKLKDYGYYREWPVVNKPQYNSCSEQAESETKYSKYYIPDKALYWRFEEITIVSDDTAFGEDYPIGSDLTPIVTFGFPSLLEFIQNGYKGSYTTEHLIRANDKEAWANLILFETGKPKLIIDRVPTVVVGGGHPTITIRLKFINRPSEIYNETLQRDGEEVDPERLLDPSRECSIKLLLDIQE